MKVCVSAVYQNWLTDIVVPQELSRSLRRADDFIRMAAVAGFELLGSQEADDSEVRAASGLILGTAFGTMQTTFDVLDQIVSGEQTSPTLFSHSVFNAGAGYMANILGIQGCALTVTDFALPFFRALQEGYLALVSGRLDCCLVLQVETYSRVLEDARKKQDADVTVWQPGVVCWLLEKVDEIHPEKNILESVQIENRCIPAGQTLLCEEQVIGFNGSTIGNDPLRSAMIIGDSLRQLTAEGTLEFKVHSPGCDATLQIQRMRGVATRNG